jgi:tRNA (cmo5U34)-methyltransferase
MIQQPQFTKTELYNVLAPYIFPQYGWLQDELLKLLEVVHPAPRVVVDLGAGNGRLLEKLLTQFPTTQAYWVDISEEFLAFARQRLASYADRVTFLLLPLEESWTSHIPTPPDVIVSMLTLHHLETHEKQRVYRQCYDVMQPGGWMFNLDEMKSVSEAAYHRSLARWFWHIEQCETTLPDEVLPYYRQLKVGLPGWKAKYLETPASPKTKAAGDDLHDPMLHQVEWLKTSGFCHVDLFVKYYLWCLIGGQKPVSNMG